MEIGEGGCEDSRSLGVKWLASFMTELTPLEQPLLISWIMASALRI